MRSLGGDPAVLLRACGLALDDLKDLDRYLPYRCVARAIEEAPRALGVPDRQARYEFFGPASALE